MRVKLGHLIERILVGRRGFLQPIEVLQVTPFVGIDQPSRVPRYREYEAGQESQKRSLP